MEQAINGYCKSNLDEEDMQKNYVIRSFALDMALENKKDFADFINLPYASVNNWGGCNGFPKYAKALLIALIKSYKYDSLIKSDSIALENDALKKE